MKAVLSAIAKTEAFFVRSGLAVRLSEMQIDDSRFREMAQKACKGGTLGAFRKLNPTDVEKIFRLALK